MTTLCTRCRCNPASSGSKRCDKCRIYGRERTREQRARWGGSPLSANVVPQLRPTRGAPVVTEAKLGVLRRVRCGDRVGVRSSWVVRMLVADGLVRSRPDEQVESWEPAFWFAELTPLGLVAVERGRVGPVIL